MFPVLLAVLLSLLVVPQHSLLCYQCYTVSSEDGSTILYNSTLDKLYGRGTELRTNLKSQILAHCPNTTCDYSCVTVQNSVHMLPAVPITPTMEPYYGPTPAPPDTVLTKFTYLMCANIQSIDPCESYQELSGDGCKVRSCKSDLCNEPLTDWKNIIIVVTSAAVSIAVCVFICLVVARHCHKLRGSNHYVQIGRVSIRRSTIRGSVRFKIGFVKTEVARIETVEEGEVAGS